MFKRRLSQWNFEKKLKAADMTYLVRKKRQRDAKSKNSTFMVGSRKIRVTDIDRYLKRKRGPIEEAPASASTPTHIRCFSRSPSSGLESMQDGVKTLGVDDPVVPNASVASTRPGEGKGNKSCTLESRRSLISPRDCPTLRIGSRRLVIPGVVALPDAYSKPQLLFTKISSYIQESVGNGVWHLDAESELVALGGTTVHPGFVGGLFDQAVNSFARSSSAIQGRRLLSNAFTLLETLLREQDPRFLEIMIDTFLKLTQRGYSDICAMLQRYMIQLASKILPKGHIWQQVCILICLRDPEYDYTETMVRSWQCISNSFSYAAGRFLHNHLVCEIDLIERLHNTTDPVRAEKLLRKLFKDHQQVMKKLDSTALYLVVRLANSLIFQGRYAEAEAVLEDALLGAREAGCLLKYREAGLLETLAEVQYQQSCNDLAETNMRHAIAAYVEEYGERDPSVIRCCEKFSRWYHEWGREEAATTFRKVIEERIGPDEIDIAIR